MRWRDFFQKHREIYVGSTQLGAESWPLLTDKQQGEAKGEERKTCITAGERSDGTGDPRKEGDETAAPKLPRERSHSLPATCRPIHLNPIKTRGQHF